MNALEAALIPAVPALTALIWTVVQHFQIRGKVSTSEVSQTVNTGQGNVTLLPSEQSKPGVS